MKTATDIFEFQKMLLFKGNHTFIKDFYESLKKTTLALRAFCLLAFLLAFQQTFAQTLQYHNRDNIIVQRSDGHGGIIKGADGIFYVWGLGAFHKENPNYNKYKNNYNGGAILSNGDAEFLEPLTAANGFPYTGNILRVAVVGSGALSATVLKQDRVLLTDDDKLWLIPFGEQIQGANQNFGITVTAPTGTSALMREAKLPVGVTAAQVTYMDGTQGESSEKYCIMLIANGNVYIAGNTESASGGTATTPTKDANGWEKVMVSAGVPLSNVKWISQANGDYFAAYTNDDEIYVWGSNTTWGKGWNSQTGGITQTNAVLFLPTGATWSNYYANKAKKPNIPFTMFNVGVHFVNGLGTDGTVYRLGQVTYGRRVDKTVYTTWYYDPAYLFNVGLNPNKWQKVYGPNNLGYGGASQPSDMHNEIWRPEYYFDGEPVTDMKFLQEYEELGVVGIRNSLDHHVMYHCNNTNVFSASSFGGQSQVNAIGSLGGWNDINKNWTFATSDTRLAYVANSRVLEDAANWGLTSDGSVCVTAHRGRSYHGYSNLTDMGIFYLKGHEYSYPYTDRPQGGWKCGKPIKADGGTFVPFGAITTPIITPTTTTPGVGTIDCNKTQLMPAPVFGTASQTVLMVTINVTTAGTFTPTVSGSGMSLVNAAYTVPTTTTGIQTFAIPLKYDGTTALGTLSFTISPAGSCTADLTKTPKNAITPIWTLDCIPTVGPGLK